MTEHRKLQLELDAVHGRLQGYLELVEVDELDYEQREVQEDDDDVHGEQLVEDASRPGIE